MKEGRNTRRRQIEKPPHEKLPYEVVVNSNILLSL
jgi:hypothetical protein